jgi:hypothetical protein
MSEVLQLAEARDALECWFDSNPCFMIYKTTIDDTLFVWWNGRVIYKKARGRRSYLFDDYGHTWSPGDCETANQGGVMELKDVRPYA